MIEPKRCDDCECYLIPIEMDDKVLFYHPKVKKECKYEQLFKSFVIGIDVVDELQFDKYIKQFKANYKIEELLKDYDELLKEHNEGVLKCLKRKFSQLWRKEKGTR